MCDVCSVRLYSRRNVVECCVGLGAKELLESLVRERLPGLGRLGRLGIVGDGVGGGGGVGVCSGGGSGGGVGRGGGVRVEELALGEGEGAGRERVAAGREGRALLVYGRGEVWRFGTVEDGRGGRWIVVVVILD